MESFNTKKLNEVDGKQQHRGEMSDRLQLWKVWTLRWILIELGKLLENIKTSAKEYPRLL
jgi:hypothetical protein